MTTRLPHLSLLPSLRTLRTTKTPTLTAPLHRSFTRSLSRTHPNGGDTQSKKEAMMDKDAINTSSNEYSKTGGGDAGAAHTSKAFDPTDTSPEGQHGGVKEEAGASNPIEVSPGNHEANKPFTEQVSEKSEVETHGTRRSSSGGQTRGAKGSGVGKK